MSFSQHRWRCPSCQSNNMPTVAACFRCGYTPSAQQPAAPVYRAVPAKRGKPRWAMIGAILISPCLIGLFGLAIDKTVLAPLETQAYERRVQAEIVWTDFSSAGVSGVYRNVGGEVIQSPGVIAFLGTEMSPHLNRRIPIEDPALFSGEGHGPVLPPGGSAVFTFAGSGPGRFPALLTVYDGSKKIAYRQTFNGKTVLESGGRPRLPKN